MPTVLSIILTFKSHAQPGLKKKLNIHYSRITCLSTSLLTQTPKVLKHNLITVIVQSANSL